MIANASDASVRRELWTSFRSLLHAYLAAGSIGVEVAQAMLVAGSDEGLVSEQVPATLDLVGTMNTVRLALHFSTGEGYWAIFGSLDKDSHKGNEVPLDEGQFRLGLDSLFTWSGKQGPLEMDAIAEALVMLVLEPGS